MTRSPGRSTSTAGPTDSTKPAPSAPRMSGKWYVMPGRPPTTCRSRWFKAAAWIATRTCPRPGAGGSGTAVTVTRSTPPAAVRTHAFIGRRGNRPTPDRRLRQERRRPHLLAARGRQRDGRADSGLHDIDLVQRVLTVLGLGIDLERQQVAGGRNGEVRDREVRARQGRDAAGGQVGAHDLLHDVVGRLVLTLHQVGEAAVLEEARLGLSLRAARESARVRPIASHQPNVITLVPRRDVGDGLPVG